MVDPRAGSLPHESSTAGMSVKRAIMVAAVHVLLRIRVLYNRLLGGEKRTCLRMIRPRVVRVGACGWPNDGYGTHIGKGSPGCERLR